MKFEFSHKEQNAEDVYSFYFNPPSDFKFLPGQYIYLTIPGLTNDNRGSTRQFTISSSPTDDHIRITTYIHKNSNYKNSMIQLKRNDILEASGPAGTFFFNDQDQQNEHLMIAGGIGVTPFISILKFNFENKLSTKLELLYSVRSPKRSIFLKQLTEWSEKHDNFDLHMTYTGTVPRGWNNREGRVDKAMLFDFIAKENTTKKLWLCGAPAMVRSIERLLKNLSVNVDNIISEKFTGYQS